MLDSGPCRIDHPSVHVELMLRTGLVAEPDRPAASIAGRALNLTFIQLGFPIDRIDDVQARPGERARLQQPVQEGVAFVVETVS